MSARVLLLLLAPLLLAACAAPAEVTEIPEPAPPPATTPVYETFDPAGYDAEPPPPQRRVEVVHDVPEELLDGRLAVVPEPEGPRTVQGFRVQLFTSESKPAADAVRDQALTWWQTVREDPDVQRAFPYGMPSAVVFARPSYRVRVGAFPDRESAQEALELLRRQFPEAFLVPDTVTLE